KAVARHLGTDHTELYVSPEDALAVIPKLATIYDEPFSDSSQVPTFLISELTRQHVTVSLSGDAGDELFCGYKRYEMGRGFLKRISALPHFTRRGLSALLKGMPVGAWDGLFKWASPALSRYGGPASVGDTLHKAADVLALPTR